MHDVGKLGIPDHILKKKGRLTEQEFAVMKEHAEIGYRILSDSDSPILQLAATIAWTHHERFDGSGYPRGLRGEGIPIEGRITAIADVFDALMSKRAYKPAFSFDKTKTLMEQGRGSHFDPGLLDLFWQDTDELHRIRVAYADSNSEGE